MAYLHTELRSFEKIFSEYIKSVENKKYRKKACRLLLDITNAPSVPKIEDIVFSFNYTNPFAILNSNVSVVNVHGTVEDGNIIFGIDQERIDPNLDIFRFTKTFRQMTETKLATKYDQEILPSRDEVTEIARISEILIFSKRHRNIFQNEGIGSKLMDYFINEAKEEQADKLILWVLEENIRAIEFYEEYKYIYTNKKAKFLDTNKYLLLYERIL